MRILVIAPFPYGTDRGSPIRARRLVELARRAGHDVRVVSYHAARPGEGVRRGALPLAITRQGFSLRKLPCDADLLRLAVQEARSFRPDVLDGHVHEGLALALATRRLAAPSARVIYNAHGTLADELVVSGVLRRGGRGHRLALATEQALVARADAVLAQSAHRAAEIAAAGQQCVHVLPDAPEPGMFPVRRDPAFRALFAPPDRPLAVYTGSFDTYQGVDDILAAAELTPHVHYLLFGSPSGDYARRAKAPSLQGRVQVVDPAPYADLPAVLAAADLALAPRHYGGNIPGKVPAYLAAGLPVVGTDVAGIRELVDGQVGAVVGVGDVAALARAIDTLAHDDSSLLRAGQAAARRAAALYGEDALLTAMAAAYGEPAARSLTDAA